MARRRLEIEIVGDADGAKRAYKQAGDQADAYDRKVAGLGSTGDKAGKDIGRGLTDGVEGASSKMDGIGSKMGGLLAAGIAGAAAVGAAFVVDQFGKALEREAGTAKLGVQLGLTPEMTQAAGKVSGKLYAQGFGDSLADTNDAVRYVTQNIGGLGSTSRDEFDQMTKGVLTLSKAFDQDLNSVTATAGTLVKTGLAENGMAALDLLTRGLQSPANKADDLLDTFTEYSTQFRQLGLSGPQALGLLSQGLAAGARDADTVADALKEFAIRGQEAIDVSNPAALAFQSLGLNGQEMAQRIAAGGPPAAEALQMTLEKLAGIEDPALRAQFATALFGTKSEDLQAALGALDLSTAETQIGNVEGAATDATTAFQTNQDKVEAWKRSVDENVAQFTANTLIPALEDIGWNFEEAGRKWDNTWGTNEDFSRGLRIIGSWFSWFGDEIIDPFVGQLQTLFGWLGDTIEKIEDFAGFVGSGIGGAIDAIGNGNLMGFADGGVVPGPIGAPQLAVVHGGETIIPTAGPSSFSMPSAAGVSSGGGNVYVTVMVEGSVTAERDLAQSVRSSLIQAGRYGQGSLVA